MLQVAYTILLLFFPFSRVLSVAKKIINIKRLGFQANIQYYDDSVIIKFTVTNHSIHLSTYYMSLYYHLNRGEFSSY